MALRKLLLGRMPELPSGMHDYRAIIDQTLEEQELTEVRVFLHHLTALRSTWAVLLPLLAWVGWRTYRHERMRLRNLAER